MDENMKELLNIKNIGKDRPILIGLAGGSGSGKTSIAYYLYRILGSDNCLLFSMDSYYKNLTPEEQLKIDEYNFDLPTALDLDLLSQHLSSLMNWREIDMPKYDFSISARLEETQRIKPNKFIIFEGIYAFYDKRIRDLMDIKIFVDLDSDIRLSRRIYRDIIERGRKLKTIIERYHKFVKPAFDNFIFPTRKYADIIIPKGAENTMAIDVISESFKQKLNQILQKENAKNNIEVQIDYKINNNKLINVKYNEIISISEANNLCKDIELTGKKLNFTLPNDELKKQKLCAIFNDFMNYKNDCHFLFYMKFICKTIFSMLPDFSEIQNSTNKVIYNSILLNNIKEIIDNIKGDVNSIKIFYFIPELLKMHENIHNIINLLNNCDKIKEIYILTVYISEQSIKELIQIVNKNIIFISIFYGKRLFDFQNIIAKGYAFDANLHLITLRTYTSLDFQNVFNKELSLIDD